MKPADFYQSLQVDKTPLAALGFNPYYQPLSGLHQGRPDIGGREFFDLASNDYLGLASDARVKEAAIGALRSYGASMCGTPIATGHARVLEQLENELATFVGLDAALVFPSCYQANLSLFSCIAGARDLIIVDHFAHASLAQGVKAVGCKVKPFLHNDLAHLERLLTASANYRQTFVVTESVFSTEGSVAPLDGMVELCRRYEAIPVVDDSHGLGVLGRTGRGILEAKAIADYEGIYTASLGKALAHIGGMIAGPADLVDALRYSCPGLIYSTALTPACAGGLLRVLEIIEHEFSLPTQLSGLGARMWQNHRALTQKLGQLGFDLQPSKAPIAAIRCGSAEATVALAREFFEAGLLATPFVPPSVPPGQGILRLIAGAKLDENGLEAVLHQLDRVSLEICA